MAKKLFIEVIVDENGHRIIVKDDAGNEKELQSIMIFGGDATSGQWYQFGFGASADAAWCVAEAMKRAFQTGHTAYMNFFKQMACHIAKLLNPKEFVQGIEPEEALNKWECEDQTKWARWDSEDVLIDKQKAEAKRLSRQTSGACVCPAGGPCTCKTIH